MIDPTTPLTTVTQVVQAAAAHGLKIAGEEVDMPEPGFPEIDGKPARQWIDDMSMG